jgi:hypothetical protein
MFVFIFTLLAEYPWLLHPLYLALCFHIPINCFAFKTVSQSDIYNCVLEFESALLESFNLLARLTSQVVRQKLVFFLLECEPTAVKFASIFESLTETAWEILKELESFVRKLC